MSVGMAIGIAFITCLLLGMPIAVAMGSAAVIAILIAGYPITFLVQVMFEALNSFPLIAIPLFIFMASMLERAGLIEEMFDVVYKWMGGLNGGLAAATILASTILAAMVGVIGAAVVTMGIIALPAMLKRKEEVVKTLTGGVEMLMKKNKITKYAGRGSFTAYANKLVTVTVTPPDAKDDKKEKPVELTAPRVIIVTPVNCRFAS